MVLELTDANFYQTIKNTEKLVIIDLWAIWCGPCRMISPIVEEVAKEYSEQIVVGKLDVDSNPQVPTDFNVLNIPTLLFIKNGEEVDRIVGAVPKRIIIDKIKKYL